jgi:hypothetical protein
MSEKSAADGRAAALAAVKWTAFADSYPPSGHLVLVKMKDGNVETARWYAGSSGWSRAPFCKWTEPVAWAVLPSLAT